jgi:hypothetical protein
VVYLSILLDRAEQIRAEKTEAEKLKAAADLLEQERVEAERLRMLEEAKEKEENQRKEDLEAADNLKEFVELMIKHRIADKCLYFVKSVKENPTYHRGINPNTNNARKKLKSNPDYYKKQLIEYSLFGKGWIISYPTDECIEKNGDIARYSYVSGLMVVSDMNLCRWGYVDHNIPYGDTKISVLKDIVKPRIADVNLLAAAIVEAGIV